MVIILAFLVVLLLLPFAIIIGVAGGITQYKRTPKPPAGLSYRELKRYYAGDWKHYERIKELEAQLKENEAQLKDLEDQLRELDE